MELPKCPECPGNPLGILLPLSDYHDNGASVIFKAWACCNPKCGFVLRIDKGTCSYDRVTPAVSDIGKGGRSLSNAPSPKPPPITRR